MALSIATAAPHITAHIGQPQHFQHALNGAVFTRGAV